MTFENEEFYAIYGMWCGGYYFGRLENYRIGEPSQVGFSHNDVMKNRSRLIGFYHTHPSGIQLPSQTDYNTMMGWCAALGRNLLCAIEEGGGTLHMWWYSNKNDTWYCPPAQKMFTINGRHYVCGWQHDFSDPQKLYNGWNPQKGRLAR